MMKAIKGLSGAGISIPLRRKKILFTTLSMIVREKIEPCFSFLSTKGLFIIKIIGYKIETTRCFLNNDDLTPAVTHNNERSPVQRMSPIAL